MVSEGAMRRAMQAYVDRFNAHDGPGLAALFDDAAEIEDPVGSGELVRGREAIDAFYARAVGLVDRLELVAPVRGSHGNAAAMAFDIHLTREESPVLIRVIDVMTFDDSGRIVTMRAYHGPGDVVA